MIVFQKRIRFLTFAAVLAISASVIFAVAAGSSVAGPRVQEMRGIYNGFTQEGDNPVGFIRTEISVQKERRFSGIVDEGRPLVIEGTVSESGNVNYKGRSDESSITGRAELHEFDGGASILHGIHVIQTNDGRFVVPCVLELRSFTGDGSPVTDPSGRYVETISEGEDDIAGTVEFVLNSPPDPTTPTFGGSLTVTLDGQTRVFELIGTISGDGRMVIIGHQPAAGHTIIQVDFDRATASLSGDIMLDFGDGAERHFAVNRGRRTKTPTRTPTPTMTATQAQTPVPSLTPTAVVTQTPIPSMTPTAIVTPTPIPSMTPTPIVTQTPIPSMTPTAIVTQTPMPSVTPTPIVTQTPIPSMTPTPTVTQTPIPSMTPTPTATMATSPTRTPTPVCAPEILHYKFDGTGTSVPNFATNPPSGTATATISGGQTQSGGLLIGTGGSSSTDFLSTGWRTNLPSTGWTITFYIGNTPTVHSGTANYIFGDNSASSFRAFYGGAAGANNIILRGSFNDVIATNSVGTTTASRVAFVYDPSFNVIRAYVAGVLVNTVAQPPLSVVGTGFFKVGGYSTLTGLSNGAVMDEFRVYRRALTSEEVERSLASYIQPCAASPTPTPTSSPT